MSSYLSYLSVHEKCLVVSGYMELEGVTCFSIVSFKMYGLDQAPNIALVKWYFLTFLKFQPPYERMRSASRSCLLIRIRKNAFLMSPITQKNLIRFCIRILNSSVWSDGPFQGSCLAIIIESSPWLSSHTECVVCLLLLRRESRLDVKRNILLLQ